MNCKLLAVSLALLLTGAVGAQAEIRLPNALSDHAVLQRGVPIRIWGWATPGAKLTVRLHAQAVATTADRAGEWTAWLMPESAGGPYNLTVQGDATEGSKTLSDILIGDVWLASGQSNMDIPLNGYIPNAPIKNGPAEIAAATNPMIRLLHIPLKSSDYPLDDEQATWTQCTPETAASFSAVAYFFGREIAAKEKVPVGLIAAAWGGVPIDSFVSLEGLTANSGTLSALANRAIVAEGLANRDAVIAGAKREDDALKAAGKPVPSHGSPPPGPAWLPAGPYNAMIAPLTKYSIKGFLWYQGETDTLPERAPHYLDLMEALIGDWRSHFAQGTLPFLYVQLSSFNGAHGWGMIRDAQRRALALRNTAMAVTLDVGEPANIHPADKQTVGARLALAARGMVYGEDIPFSSPLFRQVTTEADGMRVWFDHAEGLTTHGKPVEGFEIAGDDRKFVAAEAMIDGQTVLVKSGTVGHPVFVRYAWSGIAPPALYNSAGLPAATFSSETTPSY
jgi:sialate O-acetylesterase